MQCSDPHSFTALVNCGYENWMDLSDIYPKIMKTPLVESLFHIKRCMKIKIVHKN